MPFLGHRPIIEPVDESGDRTVFRTVEETRYFSPKFKMEITIPKDFLFDGASVPRDFIAWHFAGGRGISAACLHDYGYRNGLWTKEICDDIFLEALLEIKVPKFIAEAMYEAVHLLGASSYKGGKK